MTFLPVTHTFESSDDSPRIISNHFKEHIYRKTRLMTFLPVTRTFESSDESP